MNLPALYSSPCLSFWLDHSRTTANSGSILGRRKRSIESTFGLMETKGAGWKRREESICAHSLFIEGNCGCFHVCGCRPKRSSASRKGSCPEDNPPRRTKYRGRTRERHVRVSGRRCSLSGCTLPEDEGPSIRRGEGEWEKEIYPSRREVECIP